MDYLASINPLFYIAVLSILVLLLIILVIRLNSKVKRMMKRYERFMKGKNAEDLDEAIQESFKKVDKLEAVHQKSMIKFEEAMHSISSTYQKLGIVKYDAFKEMGGNLSFSLALLNSENNGFIINTMHGRESSYTYVKEIINGEAYSTLGEEEKEALEKAMKS